MHLAQLNQVLAGRRQLVDSQSSTTTFGTGGSGLIGYGSDKALKAVSSGFIAEKYADKSPTGFVGLVNQGATCYLNSFLQMLYMTPAYREAVFTDSRDADSGMKQHAIVRELERLFGRLALTDMPATTTNGLTRSFGWMNEDIFRQQDVQVRLSSSLSDRIMLSVPRHMAYYVVPVDIVSYFINTKDNLVSHAHYHNS